MALVAQVLVLVPVVVVPRLSVADLAQELPAVRPKLVHWAVSARGQPMLFQAERLELEVVPMSAVRLAVPPKLVLAVGRPLAVVVVPRLVLKAGDWKEVAPKQAQPLLPQAVPLLVVVPRRAGRQLVVEGVGPMPVHLVVVAMDLPCSRTQVDQPLPVPVLALAWVLRRRGCRRTTCPCRRRRD